MLEPMTRPILCPVLIGRDAQLAALVRLLDRARAGHGQIALISGEAGIGKSRLVGEVKRHAAALGLQVLQGRCFETDRTLPYAPLLELWRSPSAEIALPTELLTSLRGRAGDADEPPDQATRRLFEQLAKRLFSAEKLLIFEDLHWCDDVTLDFLLFCTRQLAHRPVLLLLTYRSDEVGPGLGRLLAALDRERLASEMPLVRLSQPETANMVGAIFGLTRAPQVDFVEALYALTDGNPFFVEEVLKTCVTEGDIFQLGGHWGRKPLSQLQIPRTVQVAVQQRVAHLTPPARELLSLAAVIGQQWRFDLLQAASRCDEHALILLLKEGIAAQLITEEAPDHFAFRHALTRQAIYNTLLAREQRLLHHAVAVALEGMAESEKGQSGGVATSSRCASLAYHCELAALWDKALHYARCAGEEAQRLQAPSAIVEQFTRALHAMTQLGLPVDAALLRARGQAYEMLGDFAAARADLEAALAAAQAADDPHVIWQSLLALGFLWTSRDFARAGAYFQEALAAARTLNDPAALGSTLNRIGNWHINMDDPRTGQRYHEEALAIFQQMGDQAGVATTLDLLAGAAHLGGDLRLGMALYTQAAQHFRAVGDRRSLTSSLAWLAFGGPTALNVMVAVAPLARCIDAGKEALQLAHAIQWRPGEAFAMLALSFAYSAAGVYGEALTLAQRALQITQEVEHGWATVASMALGTLYLDLGQYALAQQHLEDAVTWARHGNIAFSTRNAASWLALTHVRRQAFDQADRLLAAAFGEPPLPAPPGDDPFPLTQRLSWAVRAELALARNDAAQACAISDALISWAQAGADDNAVVTPRLHFLRGVGLLRQRRFDASADALLIAQRSAVDLGARPLLWRIEAALAELAAALGDSDGADAHIAAARALIDALAATLPDPALHDAFLSHAASSLPIHPAMHPPTAIARRTHAGLTARELEVAALVAQGRSDREIAEMLVLSKRTASTHVGNILNKLGFSSRSQIAAWMVEQKLLR